MKPTYWFAPEIEESTISLMWRDPDLFEKFKESGRDHHEMFAQRNCQEIFEAMDRAHEALGSLDFACVVQSCRDRGTLNEIGGTDSLNRVYQMSELTKYSDQMFNSYMDLLENYADSRRVVVSNPIEELLHLPIYRTMLEIAESYRHYEASMGQLGNIGPEINQTRQD